MIPGFGRVHFAVIAAALLPNTARYSTRPASHTGNTNLSRLPTIIGASKCACKKLLRFFGNLWVSRISVIYPPTCISCERKCYGARQPEFQATRRRCARSLRPLAATGFVAVRFA